MNKKGMVLILSFIVIVVLSVLGSAVVSRSIHEANTARRYSETAQAFWIADAGVNRALKELKASFENPDLSSNLSLGEGSYTITVGAIVNNTRLVTACGFVPNSTNPRAQRCIETIMEKDIPANFYNNAIYSAGDVDLNGNAFRVQNIYEPNPNPPDLGCNCNSATDCSNCIDLADADNDNVAILYAKDLDVQFPDNITGDTHTPSPIEPQITPLAMLDFQQLLTLSTAQNNVYAYVGNKLKNTVTGSESFPGDFWYNDGVDNDGDGTIDEADDGGAPNIVYIEGDLTLNGNVGTIGGFMVVAGDVITNPSGEYDATINGNGQVQGLIYTRGEFSVNGGGGGLNVDGGVWTGHEAELNGNATITYNKVYMEAVRNMNINADVQIRSWKDQQNPYTLSE